MFVLLPPFDWLPCHTGVAASKWLDTWKLVSYTWEVQIPFSQTVSIKQLRGRRSKPRTGTSPLQIKVFMDWTPNAIKGNQDREPSTGYKVLLILWRSWSILANASLPNMSRCAVSSEVASATPQNYIELICSEIHFCLCTYLYNLSPPER